MPEPSAEAASSEEESVEEVSRPPRRRSGGLLQGITVLVALAALALGGYAVWIQEFANPTSAAVERIEARTLELESGRPAAARTQSTQAERLDSLQAATRANADLLQDMRAALARGAASGTDAQPTPARWRVAEAAYLLRIANHRLAMERDVDAATALLEGADAVLADLDDFAFHGARSQIASELLALESHESADVQGAYLKLEALKGQLDQLPLRLPEYSSRQEAEPPSEASEDVESSAFSSTLAVARDRLAQLVRFRQHEGEALRPLLAPEQAAYLEQHLRLALERAQLALLRRDQAIFAANITDAQAWLGGYVDANHTATKQLLSGLEELSRLDVEAQPPDISGSLRALREVVPSLEPSLRTEPTEGGATPTPEATP